MAKLGEPYPFPKYEDFNKDWDAYYKAQEDAMDKIPEERLVEFPVCDGYAFYYIKSFSPPVIRHIPYGDSYYIPYPHIRGLLGKDLQEMISRKLYMSTLFGKE